MKKKILHAVKNVSWVNWSPVLAVLALCVVFACAAYIYAWVNPPALQQPESTSLIYEINFSLGKPLYHSNEQMNITLVLVSRGYSGEGLVVFSGISARGRNWLDLNKTFYFDSSVNKVAAEFSTPPCNTCAGITAGNYTVNATIYRDGLPVASITKDIEIVQ
ncbi:MAG: hypothetical protein NTU61_03755 [Candidatus Altiarchaeota archaeon]|nr:hypothetical protein [Candidatus Altiarchaeota archaeon]